MQKLYLLSFGQFLQVIQKTLIKWLSNNFNWQVCRYTLNQVVDPLVWKQSANIEDWTISSISFGREKFLPVNSAIDHMRSMILSMIVYFPTVGAYMQMTRIPAIS